MGCWASKRIENNTNTTQKRKEKDPNNVSTPNEAENNKVKDDKPINLPKNEQICDKCYYTNGKMAYCISIDKVKYIFDKKGKFIEAIQLSDEEFELIMREKGMNPNDFTVDTTYSE